MTVIKTENGAWNGQRSYGAAKRTEGIKGGRRKPWVPYSQYVAQRKTKVPSAAGTVMGKITSEVVRRLKVGGVLSSPATGKPRSNEVYASHSNVALQQGHALDTTTFFPVTWAIPTERQSADAPDDRFRVSNDTFLTGVRVRFSVLYKEGFRIRMALYKVPVGPTVHPFTQAPLLGATSIHPPQSFVLDWVQADHQNILASGPYDYVNVNRSIGGTGPLPNPVWVINSGDNTPFCADLAKGDRRPLATFQLMRNGNGTNASTDVDWYVPIKKVVKFVRESDILSWSSSYQILFYYDCPTVVPPTVAHTVAVIPKFGIKVYYR